MVTSTSLQAICVVLWIPIRVTCIRWSTLKELEVYSDKLCSTEFVEHTFLASNRLMCLVSCRHTAGCNELIFDRKSTTCYRLRSGFQNDDCLTELVGARMYQKKHCPDGWKNIDSSCYMIANKSGYHANSLAHCKSFDTDAQLAGVELRNELGKVSSWIRKEHFEMYMLYWIGTTRVGDVLRWDGWDYCPVVDIETEMFKTAVCDRSALKGLCRMDSH